MPATPASPAPPPHPGPTFEAVPSPSDLEGEKQWQAFMRWVIQERPQAAAVLQQGTFAGVERDAVRVSFASPHFADLQSEEDRRHKTEELLSTFFKRPMRLLVLSPQAAHTPSTAPHVQRKKELVREALQDDIVKQAAEILGAQLHDVKIDKQK